jgi:membrane-anchored mycosin MYCP
MIAESDPQAVSFLVALEQSPLVRGVLGRVGMTDVQHTDSELLGLTHVEGYLDPGFAGSASTGTPPGDGTEPTAPDLVLLQRLREHFASEYGGWAPTLGRNRFLGQADEEVSGGGGMVSHGGGSDPTRAPREPRREGLLGLGATVGIVDTSVYPHPDLAGGFVAAPHDLLDPAAPSDGRPYAAGHATFIAGLVLREAPAATVRVRQVLDADGRASSWDVANAIVELGRTGVQILNLSLVCYTEDGRPPLALAAAVDRLDADVLVIACAGNHGDPHLKLAADADHRKPSWPAALDDVVAVGSAHRTGDRPGSGYELSPFTPQGAAWIDVVTRGEDVVSTYFYGKGVRRTATSVNAASEADFDGWAKWSGTSFSAALLTGKVAAVAAEKRISAREAYRTLVVEPVSAQKFPPDRLPPFIEL